MYNEPQTNPAVPIESKQIYYKKKEEQPEKREPIPTINFQYYQPPKPKPAPTDANAQFLPLFTPGFQYPPQYMYPSFGGASSYMPPIVKNVYISTEGPTAHHQRLALINEDVLPAKPFTPSLTSVNERLSIYQFIRASIFNNKDGDNISLHGNEYNSLLSFIKFGDLNPYNTYKLSDNLYKGLPDDYLIYRTCYPIRRNEPSGLTMCAKDSTGVNVRIYKMLEGSFMVNRIDKKQFTEYDEWREVAFYEYLRENILKKKVCPHFPFLYGYFISEKAEIDFDKVKIIKDNKKVPQPEEPIYTFTTINTKKTTDEIQPLECTKQNGEASVAELNPNAYKGKALVLLTESPTYNISGWATKTYQKKGTNINEMVNRGIHSNKEWTNVLFQMMTGLAVLQINKTFIRNFNLENNVLVTDLTLRGQITNYWKYKIDDVDFYLPNLGYIVELDSNYKDVLDPDETTFGKQTFDKTKYKLDGKFLGSECKLTDTEIDDQIFEMIKNALDINFFGQEFIKLGGCKPPEEILYLMGKIYDEYVRNKGLITDYIIKYMSTYLHNRVGTYLRETEILNIRRDDTREIKRGQVIVYEDGHGSYKFVIYLETQSDGNVRILTKNEPNDNDVIENIVSAFSLLNYSRGEPIAQTFKANEASMNEEDLLETYIIKKN